MGQTVFRGHHYELSFTDQETEIWGMKSAAHRHAARKGQSSDSSPGLSSSEVHVPSISLNSSHVMMFFWAAESLSYVWFMAPEPTHRLASETEAKGLGLCHHVGLTP